MRTNPAIYVAIALFSSCSDWNVDKQTSPSPDRDTPAAARDELQSPTQQPLPPWPNLDQDGGANTRLKWLLDNTTSDKVDRLRQTLASGEVRLVANRDLPVAGTFGRTTAEDVAAGQPPYTVEIGAVLWQATDTITIMDLMITLAHESVHLNQCIDRGACPENTTAQLSGPECESKWNREREAYQESCVYGQHLGALPSFLRCHDELVLNTLTITMMNLVGQLASRPECQQLWLSHPMAAEADLLEP